MEIALKTAGLLLTDVDEAENTISEYPEKAIIRLGRSVSDTLRWAMYMPTALGLLGSFRVEDKGPYAGRFNIRTHGIDPLVASVWALAVSKGIVENDTLKCIFLLRVGRVISPELESALARAYEFFMDRLLMQNERSQYVDAGWIHPSTLTRLEYTKILDAMKIVERFQKYIYEDGAKEPSGSTEPFDRNTWEKVPVM
ncbi:MAG: putative nucleotidyltransferase substrate binding domain-containing protein [Syntrophorhabdaceae bacterium]|nr:hypothetical protein [Syntrophorhabdaceae bacterium]MDD4195371.1 putative nucleotidyltransferase substrate binding domain-containing protein [Syntrophorhabdaceae bacterium]HOC45051.1 putative nucleotidyltransferase substrate binding domain-containing protein [Syntrophorhabdaceae bacterium]